MCDACMHICIYHVTGRENWAWSLSGQTCYKGNKFPWLMPSGVKQKPPKVRLE